MKVLVVGAAGKTGRAVVGHAVGAGHEVTALVHGDGADLGPAVAVRVGDATDTGTVAAAVAGRDAVIDTVGGRTPYRRTTLETDVAKAVVSAMREHGVRRLVVTSFIGEGASAANTTVPEKVLLHTFLRGARVDKAGMESAVSASGLDWVITRPPVLTDKPATGATRVLASGGRGRARTIARADLAAFLVAQLTDDQYLRHAVVVTDR